MTIRLPRGGQARDGAAKVGGPRRRGWRSLIGALVLAGCCTGRGDLPGPVLDIYVSTNGGLCSESILIDGQNRVWSNAGCEGPGDNCFHERATIDASTRADLEARIAAVRAEALDPTTQCLQDSPYDGFDFRTEGDELGSHYCRASASAGAIAIVDQVRALAP